MKNSADRPKTLRRELLVAAAILQDARGRVLLVANDWGRRGRVRYTLPGGMVEPGETIPDALVREVREETGLAVQSVDRLAYVAQVEDRRKRERTIAIAFTASWEGLLNPHDPDGHIVEARFFDADEVAERLGTHLPLAEPLLYYLETHEVGRFYAYTSWSTPGQPI
ncbi:NUDIX hydrolase [Oceanithermus sp.]